MRGVGVGAVQQQVSYAVSTERSTSWLCEGSVSFACSCKVKLPPHLPPPMPLIRLKVFGRFLVSIQVNNCHLFNEWPFKKGKNKNGL